MTFHTTPHTQREACAHTHADAERRRGGADLTTKETRRTAKKRKFPRKGRYNTEGKIRERSRKQQLTDATTNY